METLSFTLGVLAVINLLLVVGAFMVVKTTNTVRNQAENTQRDLENNVHDLYRELNQLRNELGSNINKVEEQVIRHTDSRVDKLEAKVYNEFNIKKTQRS